MNSLGDIWKQVLALCKTEVSDVMYTMWLEPLQFYKLDGETATLLRPGAITADALSCICKSVEIAPAVLEQLKENERPLSPGMKYRHYAPSVPLILIDGESRNVLEFLKKEQIEKKCAILCYHEEAASLNQDNIIDIGLSSDLETQAQVLFTALRDADDLGVDVIYAHLPSRDGIGLALYNRMIRAAAHTVIKV
jgi:L-threonylcarbamoyladenylate synthase